MKSNPPAVGGNPAADRQQGSAGGRGQPSRPDRHPRGATEELHGSPGTGKVSVSEQAHHSTSTQPAQQAWRRIPRSGQRDDVETQRAAIVDEALVQRLWLQPLDNGAEHTV